MALAAEATAAAALAAGVTVVAASVEGGLVAARRALVLTAEGGAAEALAEPVALVGRLLACSVALLGVVVSVEAVWAMVALAAVARAGVE